MAKIKIYMGVCSTGDRSDAQCYLLRKLEKTYGDRIEFVYPEIYVGRIFHDFARNSYVEQFLNSDCDLLWFLDSDVVPSDRVLELVTEHYDKWQLAGCPYPVFMKQPGYESPQITYCVYTRPDPTKGMQPANIPEQGLGLVDGIATGCIFIKRSVVEKMTKPYFEFKYNPETREMTEGEDLGFCKKTSDMGLKFFIDFSMICHHFKKISLLDVSNLITEKVNETIEVCDRQIRQIVAKKQLERMNPPKQSLIINPHAPQKPVKLIL